MTRISVQEVEATFDTDLSTDAIEAWIDSAHLEINDYAEKYTDVGGDRLKELELRLTQAMMTGQDPRIDSASRETASVTYRGDTNYWMLLKGLDKHGYFAGYGKPKAGVFVPDSKGLRD
jgi:hypothetical protein